jgi:hypothetical protein
MTFFGVRSPWLLLLALSACATDQWKASEAQCRLQAMPIFPVATEQRWVHELPSLPMVQRCVQVSYKGKDGKDYVRNECSLMPLMAMPRLETIDLNQKARDDYVRSCAQQSCYQTYGNTECKLPTAQTTTQP